MANESVLINYLKQHWCQQDPFQCNTEINVSQIRVEMKYIDKVFNASYNKFLMAFDHIDYHPTSLDDETDDTLLTDPTRTKWHVPNIDVDVQHSVNILKQLDEEDLQLLTQILDKVYCIHPHLNTTHHRQKHFGLMTWVLGWGVFANSQNIKHIKQNLWSLQEQNWQQDAQIKSLANHLNLTMAQVSRHEEMLFELDMKMHIMNHTLWVIMQSLSEVHYKNDLFNYVQLCINCMHNAMHALKDDVDTFYEYLWLLATQRLTPVTVMPNILCTMLHHIEEEIKSNAHLCLAEDPNTNIWAFYNIIKVTPVVMEDTY